MQRPIIFLATKDIEFERTAINAVLASHHGLRRAQNLQTACGILTAGTRDIALAILDVDEESFGLSLLHILSGCEPDFPILVVGAESRLRYDETLSEAAVASLTKPVDGATLRREILEICSCSEMTPVECRHRGRAGQFEHEGCGSGAFVTA